MGRNKRTMTKEQSRQKNTVVCSEFAEKEKQRYERKGFGLVVAICIAVGFFIGVPYYG